MYFLFNSSENTMNLSKNLSIDKELFSGKIVKEILKLYYNLITNK
jgi:hypothetical protein